MAAIAQMDVMLSNRDVAAAGCGTGSELASDGGSAPLTPEEFLAFFWGLHLFGTDFNAVKRLVGTRQVRGGPPLTQPEIVTSVRASPDTRKPIYRHQRGERRRA